MLNKNDGLRMSDEVIDYLNAYPAFREAWIGRIHAPFFDEYISDIMTDNVTIDREKNRAYADVSENQPLADYCSVIWNLGGYTMDMGDAEELLRWMEPRWCEFKGIGSSGFFHDDMVIFDDEEDFVV